MIKRTLQILLLLIALLVLSLVFSYVFPGIVPFIDNQRLKIQAPLMKNVGDYQYGAVYMKNGKEVEGPSDISYEELLPYLHLIKPGSVILTRTRGYLSSEFIPGKWKHSAIYLGTQKKVHKYFGKNSRVAQILDPYYQTGREILIVDSNADGVNVREMKDLSNLNDISLLNGFISFHINASKETQQEFVGTALSQVGKEYDFDLRTEDKSAIYCSELLVMSLESIGINVSNFSETIGRKIISPDNLVNYIKNHGIESDEFRFLLYLEKENNKLQSMPLSKE
ncbi:MAG: YiiX/YebB-like N1pC/P60 family cysteine hydrolase [Bacteroidales bacterium]